MKETNGDYYYKVEFRLLFREVLLSQADELYNGHVNTVRNIPYRAMIRDNRQSYLVAGKPLRLSDVREEQYSL